MTYSAYDTESSALTDIASEAQSELLGSGALWSTASSRINGFVASHNARPGPVVLKTSTADLRERNHEPDHRLLELILSTLRESFPDRQLVLCDGPAFKANYVEIAEQHGWTALAKTYDAEVLDLNELPAKPILDGAASIASLCEEAALTISIGKAKTHRRTGISGAEKARVGYLSGTQMGYPKLERKHFLLPPIYRAIDELCAPTLHVVDGIDSIQGNGPMRGTPMSSEFLIIGEDPTAVDIQLALAFEFDPALTISLLGSLERSQERRKRDALNGIAAPETMFLTTERSVEAMRKNPTRPPKEQPWLYRSLAKQGSRRNRRNYATIQKAFAEVSVDV